MLSGRTAEATFDGTDAGQETSGFNPEQFNTLINNGLESVSQTVSLLILFWGVLACTIGIIDLLGYSVFSDIMKDIYSRILY